MTPAPLKPGPSDVSDTMAASANISRRNFLTRRFGRRLKIFLSYRRRFDAASARLLKDELTKAFGERTVFRDVDDITPGEDFPERIREAVASCDAFLTLISPGWVDSAQRLQDPDDFVRREITAAFVGQVPVIPVLIGGARMPDVGELPVQVRSLASRQACELSDGHWEHDVQRLVEAIRARAARPTPESFADRAVAAFKFLFGTRLRRLVLAAALLASLLPLYFGEGVTQPPRDVNYDECLKLIRVFGPHESAVELNVAGAPIVGTDKYGPASEAPPSGFPLLVRLSDSGQELGAVSMRYFSGPSEGERKFVVELVVEPPCVKVENFSNAFKPALAHTLADWDTLRLSLRGRDYLLRLGDKGDRILATLTPGS